MGRLLLLVGLCLLLTANFAHAEDIPSIFSPVREGSSNYITAKEVAKARKYFKGKDEAFLLSIQEELKLMEADISTAKFEEVASKIEDFHAREIGKVRNHKIIHEHALALMRDASLVDDAFVRLMTDFVEQTNFIPDADERLSIAPIGPGLTLKDYLLKKGLIRKYFNRMSKNASETVSNADHNPFPLKEFKTKAGKHSKLSVRERLLYLYSAVQIKEMAGIMDLALNVADASRVYTTIEFRDRDAPMIINHSPTEQYRLAIRIMRMEKEDAEQNQQRLGLVVSDLDMIGSAYELGIVSYEEISLITKNKDFYLPEVSLTRKVAGYLGKVTLLALRIHPATAAYAIIPIMIWNSYQDMNDAKNKVDEDSFFFTLPKRQ